MWGMGKYVLCLTAPSVRSKSQCLNPVQTPAADYESGINGTQLYMFQTYLLLQIEK